MLYINRDKRVHIIVRTLIVHRIFQSSEVIIINWTIQSTLHYIEHLTLIALVLILIL